MLREYDRKLVFEDGSEFYGFSFGDTCDRVCRIVFNTSMVGCRDIISDPSYTDLAVVMTYPLIGSYGADDDDFEMRGPSAGCLIVSEYSDLSMNSKHTKSLDELLQINHIPGIEGVDTRRLTRFIRDNGSRPVLITAADTDRDAAAEIIKNTAVPHDAVSRVSCRCKWYSHTLNHKYNVVAIDCGIMPSAVRNLNARGCNVTVVPYDTTAGQILAMRPDGLFISNGPGDPRDVGPVIELIRALRGKIPMFGICLGHELMALACGAKISELKFGHGGSSHPVRDLRSGKIEITCQNHSYTVDADSLEGTGLTATHVNVIDGSLEGCISLQDKMFGVQYHPDSEPGARDGAYLYDIFTDMMKEGVCNA